MVIGEPVAALVPDEDVEAVELVGAVLAVDEPPLEHPAATSGSPTAATRSNPVMVRYLSIVPTSGLGMIGDALRQCMLR